MRWDEVWTPGANWATTLEVSKDVTLNGKRVPKGKYSVWMVVKDKRGWTTVLDPKVRRYHMEPPGSSGDQIRFPVRPRTAPFADVLTWSMPALSASGGTLAVHWATTLIAMDLAVEPSLRMTMSAAEAAPYVGRYEYQALLGPDSGKTSTLTVTHEDNTLKGSASLTTHTSRRSRWSASAATGSRRACMTPTARSTRSTGRRRPSSSRR